MKYIYGPLLSRRLGNSLGISIIPYKVCNFDCAYCQLKETKHKTTARKSYVAPGEISKELKVFFDNKPPDVKVDYITISGSGEPTLNTSLPQLIKNIRAITDIPLVLITNSSTMVDPKIRREISGVDIAIPSLDAVTQDIFERIDNPKAGIRIDKIIEGLVKFRREFKGKIWLEVMLVKGLNDDIKYLRQIKEVVDRIKPDRVQLNSPVRPPAQSWVKPASSATLKKAKEIFGENCDIV